MFYLLSQFWLFVLLAFVIGAVVAWFSARPEESARSFLDLDVYARRILFIGAAVAAIALAIAIFHFFRGSPGLWWDVLLLLLAAYVIGCVVGCLARRWQSPATGGLAFAGAGAAATATASLAREASHKPTPPAPPKASAPAAGPPPAPSPKPSPAPSAPVASAPGPSAPATTAPTPTAGPAAVPTAAPKPSPMAAPSPATVTTPAATPFPTAPVIWSAPAGVPAVAPPTPIPAAAPAAPPIAPTARAATPQPATVSPYTWLASWNGSSVSLGGYVPSEAARTDVLSVVRDSMPNAVVTDRMKVGGGAPSVHTALTGIATRALASLVDGRAFVTDGALGLVGTAADAVRKDSALTRVATLPPGARLGAVDVRLAPAPAAPTVETAVPVPTPEPEPAVQFDDADPSIVAAQPKGLDAARGGKADDLKRIRGIGKVNEGRLNGLGIWHFDQVAAWTAAEAKWVNSFLAFPGRIQREDWIGQARVLATGADTEFSKRVDRGEVPTSQGGPSIKPGS